MRSQGARAREFRDWAEDVLYEVMMTGSYNTEIRNEGNEILSTIRYKDYNAVLNYDAIFLFKEAFGSPGRYRNKDALSAITSAMTELGTALAYKEAHKEISLVDDSGDIIGKMSREKLEGWLEQLIELKIGKALENSKVMDWKKYKRMLKYREMGLSQKDIGKLLDVHKDTIRFYEKIERDFNLPNRQLTIVNRQSKGGAAL